MLGAGLLWCGTGPMGRGYVSKAAAPLAPTATGIRDVSPVTGDYTLGTDRQFQGTTSAMQRVLFAIRTAFRSSSEAYGTGIEPPQVITDKFPMEMDFAIRRVLAPYTDIVIESISTDLTGARPLVSVVYHTTDGDEGTAELSL